MLGLGRMGANMVRRLMKNEHECVVFDQDADVVKQLADEGAVGTSDMDDFISKLAPPRPVWMMVPAAVVDSVIEDLSNRMSPGDILIDGGNSFYKDDIARAKQLATNTLHYVDVGTSGGVWGLERGYCLMIGGEKAIVEHLDPIFSTIAPGMGDIDRTTGRDGAPSASEFGYLHCGSQWRRAFRQNGSQRHRVRHHGRLRGGYQYTQACQRGQPAA
jgi:6-phosphogluconate dehydrogenase